MYMWIGILLIIVGIVLIVRKVDGSNTIRWLGVELQMVTGVAVLVAGVLLMAVPLIFPGGTSCNGLKIALASAERRYDEIMDRYPTRKDPNMDITKYNQNLRDAQPYLEESNRLRAQIANMNGC